MIRTVFRRQVAAVADGGDPVGVIRQAAGAAPGAGHHRVRAGNFLDPDLPSPLTN